MNYSPEFKLGSVRIYFPSIKNSLALGEILVYCFLYNYYSCSLICIAYYVNVFNNSLNEITIQFELKITARFINN